MDASMSSKPDTMPRWQCDIVIIGAGMAGLGAALALATLPNLKSITILEADDELNEAGGGLQLSPNCIRVLDTLGVAKKLAAVAMHLDSIKFRRYATGEIIGQTDIKTQMQDKYGYPYWLVRRTDFQKVLYDGAIQAGARILFGQRVAGIYEQPGEVVVMLETGERHVAGIVIGADGIRSKCRKSIFPESVLDPIPTDSCAYRAVIEAKRVRENLVTQHLLRTTDSNAWLGPHRQLLGYPIRDGKDFNIVGIHLGRVADLNKSSEMVEDLGGMRQDFKDFDPVVQELLKMVESAQRWQLQNVPALEKWSSPTGHCVLMGDAAHAMVPFLAQGASSAIEDAAVLRTCLSRAIHGGDIAAQIRLFEAIRLDRINDLRRGAYFNERILHLPDGPEQRKRDQYMKAMEGERCYNLWSDPVFSHWLFGYDASTVIEQWQAGGLKSRACSNLLPEEASS